MQSRDISIDTVHYKMPLHSFSLLQSNTITVQCLLVGENISLFYI